MGSINWQTQQKAVGQNGVKFGINDSPAICDFNGNVFMAWNGSGDDGIFYSVYNVSDNAWATQALAFDTNGVRFGINENSYPTVAEMGGKIFMAWNGSGENGIWFSIFDPGTGTWSPQVRGIDGNSVFFGILDNTSPAVTTIDGNIFMAWNGSGDNGIWTSTYTVSTGQWSVQHVGVDAHNVKFGLQGSPSVTALNNTEVFMTWNGSGNDGIWYATYDHTATTWNIQQRANYEGTLFQIDSAPSVTFISGNLVLMTWNGVTNSGVYYSFYNTSNNLWTEDTLSVGKDNILFCLQDSPSCTYLGNNNAFVAFNGCGDDGIYYSLGVL